MLNLGIIQKIGITNTPSKKQHLTMKKMSKKTMNRVRALRLYIEPSLTVLVLFSIGNHVQASSMQSADYTDKEVYNTITAILKENNNLKALKGTKSTKKLLQFLQDNFISKQKNQITFLEQCKKIRGEISQKKDSEYYSKWHYATRGTILVSCLIGGAA